MHKKIYASGFIYNPSARKILLQKPKQIDSSLGEWYLFGKEGSSSKEPEEIFKQAVRQLLKIKLETIENVYSYFSKDLNKNHFILYAETDRVKNFSPKKGFVFGWFTFKQILKLPIGEQTKHDLIVSQRVISAKVRKSRGERTLE